MLVWLCERRRNPEHFGGSLLQGIGAGLWWAATTMTTVGYGDKVPVTPLGRIIGLVWMYLALILLTSFLAAFTALLTVSELSSVIDSPYDLTKLLVATVTASSSEAYLKQHRIPRLAFDTLSEGLQAVVNGEADAAVYDDAPLRYLMLNDFSGRVKVLPFLFAHQNYGIALPSKSLLREPINRALLHIVGDELWMRTLEYYIGKRQS
jgi:ABC-type amino acid transport substrate-binding protein